MFYAIAMLQIIIIIIIIIITILYQTWMCYYPFQHGITAYTVTGYYKMHPGWSIISLSTMHLLGFTAVLQSYRSGFQTFFNHGPLFP